VGILRGGSTGQSAFRIDTDPLTYDLDPLRPNGKLRGVPPWALAAMRHAQPFPGNTLQHMGEAIVSLNSLAIIDRHRALLLAGSVIDLDQVWAGTTHPGQSQFTILDGGRALELDYPVGAEVSAHVGATVLVKE